jgi:N-hydroxyarylamine O-acetyltransferase
MRLRCELPELDSGLRKQVLRRLGFLQAPAADLDGLRAVYRAWCSTVPFDNIRKMIALRTDGCAALPGGTARQFFEDWLSSGTGGTCWPTSNALFELLVSLGFRARRAAGCMHDLGVVNHGSVKVGIDDRLWLVDTSLLTNVPLPLDGGMYFHDDPVFAIEVEHEESTHVVWSCTPPNSQLLPCRLSVDGAGHSYYLARYEESRQRSPFNRRLYARWNRPGEMLVLVGNTRYSRTAQGTRSRTLSPGEVCQALHVELGFSNEVIEEWASAGCLEDSFKPPSGPKPPPATRRPPSQR